MLINHILSEQKNAQISAVSRYAKGSKILLENVNTIYADVSDEMMMSSINDSFDYIIHCASETKSKNMIDFPVETSIGIVDGTKNVLELAKRCRVKSMVFLSSMEVYGSADTFGCRRICEDELGHVDLFNVRSCYPMAKRMAESLCYYYFMEYGLPVKIARLAQTFGKGVPKNDNRVFAQFAKSVINNSDIILNTDGMSMGNYCDISDTIHAIMILLERGTDGESYNVVNEDSTMTIREMAELVANDIAQGSIKVVVNGFVPNQFGYASQTKLRLSGKKMSDLGWKPKKTLKQMYLDLINEMRLDGKL